VAVIVYFIVVLSIGLYMARRQKTKADYFIARRRIHRLGRRFHHDGNQ